MRAAGWGNGLFMHIWRKYYYPFTYDTMLCHCTVVIVNPNGIALFAQNFVMLAAYPACKIVLRAHIIIHNRYR